jgi:hypothetical protein
MTYLGRILTTIILLLSLGFMYLALAVNASHRNWRDVVLNPNDGLKKQVAELEQTNQQLADSRQRTESALAREQAARRTALAALQTQVSDLQAQLQRAAADVQALQAQNSELAQTDKSRAEQLARLTEANEALEQKIIGERADRDQLFAKSLELTDQYNQALGLLDTLTKYNETLVSDVSRFKEVLDARGINVDDPIDGAPPERNGVVLAVTPDRRMVEVSIGYDEGLRDGHELRVTRDGRYLGKLRVQYTQPDTAVAEVLDDYRQGPIRKDDRVDTIID